MRLTLFALLSALAVAAAVHPATAQKFLPKTIQFEGAPEYTNQELLDAAGLKNNEVLSYADMQDYSKRLLATGAFASVAFKFDGQDLIFMLIPSEDLCQVRFENLPLAPGKELDDQLHKLLPLYHGKVPAEAGLTDQLQAALGSILAEKGLPATVVATTSADVATHKVNAVTYSITSPPVAVSIESIDGVSASFLNKVREIVTKVAAQPYETSSSVENIQRLVEQFYGDQGYAAAKVEVTRAGDPAKRDGAILVPLSIQVHEGHVYRVTAIHLPADAPVTQAEIDKALEPSTAGPPMGVRVRSIWMMLSNRIKSKGYLDCTVTPHAEYNETEATVSYTAEVNPGPLYRLGFVKFDNVTDALRAQLIHNWQMMPGDPFDAGYVGQFVVQARRQDPVLNRSLEGVKMKYDITANPDTHEVNVVIRLER